MKFRLFTLLVAVASLAGCSSIYGGKGPKVGEPAKDGTSPKVELVKDGILPPPMPQDAITAERPYLIGPYDKLVIDVYGIEELSNREIQADASGRISFPLVGVIQAGGRTPNEVEDLIEAGLRSKFIRNPQVSVNVKESVSQVFTVDGEVKRPGLYPVVGKMTLMRAVARAEGTTEFAKKSEVLIFRQVGDKQMVGLYDLRAIRVGAYADPEIFPNDVIVVGESVGRRVFRDAIQVVPLLTTPLVGILVAGSN